MKIQATCNTCGRTFLLAQIGPDSDAPGRCPFCGAHFARHYSTVLVDAVQGAEASAASFVHAMSRLQALDAGFDIAVEDFLKNVVEQIQLNTQQRAAG